jgi:hypothetical protein
MELYAQGQYEKAEQVNRESIGQLAPDDSQRLSFENNMVSNFFRKKQYIKAKHVLYPALEKMQLQGHPHRRISRFVRLFSSACYCCK